MFNKKKLLLFLAGFALLVGWFFREYLYVRSQQFLFGIDNLFYHSKSKLEHIEFDSKALNNNKKAVYVYLPAGYIKQSKTEYPTLYLLHGDPGNEEDWVKNGDVQRTLDQLIGEKKIGPLIVVIPDGNGLEIENGQYVNADLVKQDLEDYIAYDLVGYIDTNYHTIQNRGQRAIAGNSSGGYGALNIGFHHPDIFSVLISLSGYTTPAKDNASQLLKPESIERNSIMFDSANFDKNYPMSVFLYYGTDDYFNPEKENDALYKKLIDEGVNAKLITDGKSHNWSVWSENIVAALIFMNQQFQK